MKYLWLFFCPFILFAQDMIPPHTGANGMIHGHAGRETGINEFLRTPVSGTKMFSASEAKEDVPPVVQSGEEEKPAPDEPGNEEEPLHYSFGVLYIPNSGSYFSSYSRYYFSGDESIIYNQVEYSETRLLARFTYLFTRRLGLMAELGYSANYYKIRSEDHSSSNSDSYDDGGRFLEESKILSALLSVKYYLFSSPRGKVQPYVFLGAGKEFADFKSDYERLFVEDPPPDVIIENSEKYKSDINSPFLVIVGFGVEYFFDDALSLFSIIRVSYRTASGEYQYKHIYNDADNTERWRKKEVEFSKTSTNVGIGLNFYF